METKSENLRKLVYNKSTETLDLRNNKIGVEGAAKEIADLVKINKR